MDKTQYLLVTKEQYKFLSDYYEKMGIYPNGIGIDKFWFDNGFELVFKGVGISPYPKDGFEIIDLQGLGNDLSKWIRRFYEKVNVA